MAYCSVAEVAAYGNFNAAEVSTHTALLTALISRAQAQIERMTGRVFEVAADSTKSFDQYETAAYVSGAELVFFDDLCALTSVTNNGVLLDAGDYVTYGLSDGRITSIRLKNGAWLLDQTQPVQIVGKWGYSAAVPDPIKQATIELVLSMWLRRDQVTVNGPTTVSVDGKVILSSKVPEAVLDIVAHYKRYA